MKRFLMLSLVLLAFVVAGDAREVQYGCSNGCTTDSGEMPSSLGFTSVGAYKSCDTIDPPPYCAQEYYNTVTASAGTVGCNAGVTYQKSAAASEDLLEASIVVYYEMNIIAYAYIQKNAITGQVNTGGDWVHPSWWNCLGAGAE